MPEFVGTLGMIMVVAILVPVLVGLRHWRSPGLGSEAENFQAMDQ